MLGFLRQSTASQVVTIGPFFDRADFVTAENGLTIANTDIKLKKNGGASGNKNSGGATADGTNGLYHCTFDATDTGTVGELHASVDVAGALPWHGVFRVLEEAVYDALFAASAPGYVANAPVNVAQFGGSNGTFSSGRPEVNASHISGNQTTADNLETLYGANLITGTATAGAATTITLGTGISFGTNILARRYVAILAGTGAGQSRMILSNTNANPSVVTVDNAWTTNPSTDSVYCIFGHSGSDVRLYQGSNVPVQANVTQFGSSNGTFSGGRPEVNTTHWGGTVVASANVLIDNAITAAKIASDAITSAKVADGFLTAAKFASGAFDAVWSVATRILTAGTNIVLAKGTGVTGFTDLSAAQVNAEVDTALADIHLDRLLATTYDPASKPGAADALLNELVENDGGVARFSANTLEQAPSGGGGGTDWTADERTAIKTILGVPGSGTTPEEPSAGALKVIDDLLDTEVAAIKAKTDNLPSDPADQSAVEAAITAATSPLATQSSVNDLPTNAELATALASADDATLAAIAALNNISAADVNAQVLDVLNVDTFAEPGQGAPAATTTLAAKINYLYKAWRNKKTQTSSQTSLYADDGTTVDQKATFADDGTTATSGEMAAGP